jgi:predicted nucleic acid-binding protein
MQPRVRVFIDTSVLFAGVLSAGGGSRVLLKLGEAGLLSLWVGPTVLQEADEVLRRKAAESRPLLALLLERAAVGIAPPPDEQMAAKARAIVSYPPDALVLGEAMAARPDWFVTLDRKHFVDNPQAARLPFRVGVPGDLLALLRETDLLRTATDRDPDR